VYIKSEICFLNKHNTEINDFKVHSHNCWELVYCLSGTGTVHVGRSNFPFAENDCFIISPNTGHTESFEGYGEIMFIGFKYECPELNVPLGRVLKSEPAFLTYFNRIFDEYKKQELGYREASKALLDVLLVMCVRATLKDRKSCKDLDYTREYIEQYFDRKIDFCELAKLSGYSSDHFRSLFKKRFGISPQGYLIDIRIKNAKRMLEFGGLTCTEVAYRCGFSNSAQMATMFKKKLGIVPSAVK